MASDGSTDDTAAIVGRLAEADPRVRLLDLPRGGQTVAQNAIFTAATGDVVVLSDAETRFAPGCLAALVAPFADRRVGCTTGHLDWLDEDRTATSRNEGAYWRYEQAVRRAESRAGWLTAVTGALLAVRMSAVRPVPAHASMDHLLPLYARDQGLVVLAVPDARGFDRGIGGIAAQFRNRSRTATRGIRSNLSMAGRLAPWRRPSAALAIWSHKLLRWSTPWLAAIAAVGGDVAGAQRRLGLRHPGRFRRRRPRARRDRLGGPLTRRSSAAYHELPVGRRRGQRRVHERLAQRPARSPHRGMAPDRVEHKPATGADHPIRPTMKNLTDTFCR